MKLENDTRLLNSKAYVYFLKTFAMLAEKKLEQSRTKWNDQTTGIVYMMDGDTIVSYMAYDRRCDHQSTKTASIISCYVESKYRDSGVFELMLDEVEKTLRSEGFVAVNFITALKNSEFVDLVRNKGYNSEAFLMYKKVKI